jgi:hypothetical protein
MAEHDEQPTPPPLAKPDAARKVGEGFSERLGETIDDTGKLLAAIAGFGIFFFGAGYFVEWQRFKRGGLPPEEILPLIPKSQVAAAGVKELVISIFFGILVIAVVSWAAARFVRWATRRVDNPSWVRRTLATVFAHEGVTPTVILGGLIFLFVPLDWAGVIVAVVLTLLLFYSLRLLNGYLESLAESEAATFPLWRLLIAAAIAAVVLTGARQRAHVFVTLKDQQRVIKGSYVGSDSDTVLVRQRLPDRQPQLLILNRSDVARIQLEKGSYVFPTAESLFGTIFDTNFACIPPECRAGDSRVGISTLF